LLVKNPDNARRWGANELRIWLWDPAFAGVRGPEALAKLPKAEHRQWQKLWDDVAEMLNRTLGKK
jgi:hypothetical protein